MFRLASCQLMDRKVLLVEDDEYSADVVAQSVKAGGGTLVGYATTLEQAVQIANSHSIDLVLLHIRYVQEHKGPISELFASKGISVEFLACFEDWFDFADCDDVDRVAVNQA